MSVGKARNNLFELIQKQLKKRPNPELYNSPEHRPSNDLKQTKSRSLFLTQFDRMEKTKALWRNLKPINHKNNKQDPSVCSWAELDRLKNKYRTELLRRKSKEQIFQENMNMILKIEQIPPQVETWNLYKPKKSSRSSSNEDLLIKNLELIKKIEETEPKVENWNVYKPKKSPRSLQRTKEKLKIFEQNMKIIDNIQAAPPKVDSWSLFKPKRNKNLIIQRTKRKEKLFEQNMKIIQRVESIPPKVQSWADIKSMRKKAERKKSLENRSSQKIEKLKRMIEKVEENLYQQQLSQHKNRRMKTLPERIDRCEKYKANHDLTVKRLQVKIDKTKSNIDCWVKGKQLNKGVRKNAVLCNAHKMKQIQRFKKNMESCLNLQGPSVKKF